MTHPTLSDAKPVPENRIRSSFAEDPDMAELVEMFVDDASSKVDRLNQAIACGDWNQVRVFAHQLKGAAAGYGFSPLSDLARELETSASLGAVAEVADHGRRVIEYLAAIEA